MEELSVSADGIRQDFVGNLYVGGYFTSAGGVAANHIAKWDGSNWSAVGSGVNSSIRALAVDGANQLYIGGDFSTAGGKSSDFLAKWVSIISLTVTIYKAHLITSSSILESLLNLTGLFRHRKAMKMPSQFCVEHVKRKIILLLTHKTA